MPRVARARDLTAGVFGVPRTELEVPRAQVEVWREPWLRQTGQQAVDESRFQARRVGRRFPVDLDIGVQRIPRGHTRAVASREQAEDRTLDADARLEPSALG